MYVDYWARNPISLKHVSFWYYPLMEPHHIPLKYRCLNKKSNQIRVAFLMVRNFLYPRCANCQTGTSLGLVSLARFHRAKVVKSLSLNLGSGEMLILVGHAIGDFEHHCEVFLMKYLQSDNKTTSTCIHFQDQSHYRILTYHWDIIYLVHQDWRPKTWKELFSDPSSSCLKVKRQWRD